MANCECHNQVPGILYERFWTPPSENLSEIALLDTKPGPHWQLGWGEGRMTKTARNYVYMYIYIYKYIGRGHFVDPVGGWGSTQDRSLAAAHDALLPPLQGEGPLQPAALGDEVLHDLVLGENIYQALAEREDLTPLVALNRSSGTRSMRAMSPGHRVQQPCNTSSSTSPLRMRRLSGLHTGTLSTSWITSTLVGHGLSWEKINDQDRSATRSTRSTSPLRRKAHSQIKTRYKQSHRDLSGDIATCSMHSPVAGA